MPLAETAPAPRGTETILLVEPEPDIRKLAVFMLSRQGYQVLEARNAAEAVKLFQESDSPVDLLLTEAAMSRVNGHELSQRLAAQNPDLRTLFLCDPGYERVARRATGQKGLSFLPRPFTMRSLAGKVRQVLDAPQARFLSAGV